MGPTDSLRRQHDEMLAVATEIAGHLTPEGVEKNAETISSLLSKLSGKLKMHLAMEDKSLYPQMLNSTDPDTKITAEKFISEMGELSTVFANYIKEWHSVEAMRADPAKFISTTGMIFDAVSKRIERENNQLYPKLEAVT